MNVNNGDVFVRVTSCRATFWVGRRFVARRFGIYYKNDVLSRDILSRDVLSGDVLPWYQFKNDEIMHN
jgi:hypothetical protein